MMNSHALTASRAKTYHEHQKEYYTKNLTNRDRWHGALAKTLGLEGEVRKAVFDTLVDTIEVDYKRTNAAFDKTFSAPKSVSLALAYDIQTHDDMIACHQEAMDYIAREIEQMLCTQITVAGKKQVPKCRNMVAAEFLHTLARPSEDNDNIPDLDLHSHLVICNMTVFNGKNLALDWRDILNERIFKRLSVLYRAKLAESLKSHGYEIELTDAKRGFFELAGFSREVIEKYSHREAEVKRYAKEHGVDIETAKIRSRKLKKEASLDAEQIIQKTREDLFAGKNMINIKRKAVDKDGKERTLYREQDEHAHNRTAKRSEEVGRKSTSELEHRIGTQLDLGGLLENSGQGTRQTGPRDHLPDLRECDLVATTQRTDMLLSETQLSMLAGEQIQRIRSVYLQRMESTELGGGLIRKAKIDKITKGVIDDLQAQAFAFKLDTAIDRIMCAGVCEGITETEARRALSRAGVVNAGPRIQQEGQKRFKKKWNNPHAPVYVTTRKNLETEKAIVDMFHAGQGAITKGVLTEEQSRKLLDEVENELIAKGETDFYISGKNGKQGVGGEQGEALHAAIFCSKNRVTIIEGWAGTGKTSACQRAKLMADAAGIKIRGISFTNTAALNLQNESGIPSTSIHALLGKAERGELDEHDVIDDKKLDEKLIQPEVTTAEKLQSVVDAIGENFIEVLNNGHGASPDKHIPERTMKQKVQRSLKEIFAEALLPPRDARKFKAKLRREDHKLYFQQQRGEVIPEKGADSKPLTGADMREDVLFDSLRDIISQDIFNIPDPEPTRNIPHRSMKGKVGRALKEILAEAFFDPTTAAKYRAELERQDEELFQLQQGKQPKKDVSKGKDKQFSPQPEQDKIKNDWDLSNVRESREPEVYIMDEAGLTDMHLFKYALEFCSKRGAKLCLLGDTGQLVPVGAGMPLKLLEDEGAETRYLTDIRRQKDDELREVAKTLADREKTIDKAIKYFKDDGITRENRQQLGVRKQKIMDGEANRLPSHKLQSTPLLVGSYAERRQFNQAVREILVKRGDIQQGTEFQITDPADIANGGGKRYFAEGDRIQFLDSNKEIGAVRGHFGTIEKIDGQNITVKTDKDKTVTIDMTSFSAIDHGYATRAKCHELALPNERQTQAVIEATEDVKIADYAKNLLLVDTNEQRLEYNAAIREVFIERGELDKGVEFKITDPTAKKPELESTRFFAAGDRVIFTKKDKKLKVENNLLGTIESVDAKNRIITVRTDMDEIGTVKIDMRKYNNIDYAYALTEYKGQGKTVDKAICIMDTKHSHKRNDFYVAITRARYEAVLVTDNLKKFEKQVQKFAEKESGKDFKTLKKIRERHGEIEQSELYHYIDDQQEQMERAIEQVKKYTVAMPEDIPDFSIDIPDLDTIPVDMPQIEDVSEIIKTREAEEKVRKASVNRDLTPNEPKHLTEEERRQAKYMQEIEEQEARLDQAAEKFRRQQEIEQQAKKRERESLSRSR